MSLTSSSYHSASSIEYRGPLAAQLDRSNALLSNGKQVLERCKIFVITTFYFSMIL